MNGVIYSLNDGVIKFGQRMHFTANAVRNIGECKQTIIIFIYLQARVGETLGVRNENLIFLRQ